ncbi:MAG: Ig-like domain-containing protein, partial [Clostridium sp.]|nr:Ig-like domain-containing protein [Clostridium sp.]
MNAIDKRFKTLLKKQGEDIEINGVLSRGLFTEIEENNSYDLKKLFTEENVKQGNIIKGLDTYWIVTNKDVNIKNNIYSKCVVTKAIHNIKIYIENQLYEFPAIIKTQAQSINYGQYINTADGKIILVIQDNDFTKKINYNDRFIKMGSVWKVTGFTSENEGLRYLYCEKGTYNDVYDDIKEEIADRWKYETKHEYVITVEPTTVTLNLGDTQQLTVSVTDNGVEVKNPTLIYISSDNTICSVDENGLITANAIGTTEVSI